MVHPPLYLILQPASLLGGVCSKQASFPTLSRFSRYDVPSSSRYEPRHFAAVPSTSRSAEDQNDGSLPPLLASGREANLGQWGSLDQQGAYEASPASANASRWKPDAAEDFATSNWKPDSADDFGDAAWKSSSADDFRASEWVPDVARDFQPSEWTPESLGAVEWQPESAEAFAPSEWRPDGNLEGGQWQYGAADDAPATSVWAATDSNGPVGFVDAQSGAHWAPDEAESSWQQSGCQTVDYGDQGVAQHQWKGYNSEPKATQQVQSAEHEGTAFKVAAPQQQGGLQPRTSTAARSPSRSEQWGQKYGQLKRRSERRPSVQGISTQMQASIADEQQVVSVSASEALLYCLKGSTIAI